MDIEGILNRHYPLSMYGSIQSEELVIGVLRLLPFVLNSVYEGLSVELVPPNNLTHRYDVLGSQIVECLMT